MSRRTPVLNPYDDSIVGEVTPSDEAAVRAAIGRASAARPLLAALPAHRRGAVLNQASRLIEAQTEDLARLMAQESGKPLRYARGEAKRAVETFAFAADEARRLHGETVPLDAAQSGVGRIGYFVRVPVGVVAAITPFNFPLNLVAHKVAPAVAAGCPLVLKPNPTTPLTALRLAEILAEAGLPEGGLEVVVGGADVGTWLTSDPRVAMISFTGSPPVARAISQVAGLRRTVFELGGNAATVIDETVDIGVALEKTVVGSFAYSGQVCISIQRIYVQRSRYDEFRDQFVERTNRLVVGNPLAESTEVGPLINDAAAERIDTWIQEAVAGGAAVLTGGTRRGRTYQPTVLENVTREMRVMREEVFGPVVNLIPFDDFDQALDAVNDSDFGLQAGVYTRDLARATRAIERLDVGGVMINDVPTFRVDHMPYGGNKLSGVGREGPRFAIEAMTTLKMVVINPTG
jgi:acyl-CoA reductase-like NAD-dependent aldehyde dehydrogenase